ncbi:MAG TPA: sulfoxide reductase heme-binding subunit YedZ [Sedimenticola thiotaurini]|uniref:Protein-methionine-sulfoxide reductase heme-binding subunit MsrQ n=1 Tax=Sedimenticola thiotaurini TaxID=1543721 RepID=A0A831RND2_9GAMM|nr:sulfoxide reductase heme-binding subunit YedZ [Sedimenticola thiotaurini]
MTRARFIVRVVKPAAFLLMLLPAVLLLARGIGGELGANPVETITRSTGDWTLRLLLLTLAVTPLRRLTGWGELLRLRRMIGLFSFFYACLHLATYVVLDLGFNLSWVAEDVVKRPYITLGFSVFLLLLPLALTSTNRAIRRLGRRWKRLHRLVYLCAIGGVIHFLWLVKADLRTPLIYLAVLLLLFALRIPGRWFRLPPLSARRPVG